MFVFQTISKIILCTLCHIVGDLVHAQNKEGRDMDIATEKKFAVEIVYNGVTKPLDVQPEEQVTAVLKRAIRLFGITQNPHLLSLFDQGGNVVPENESAEQAGLTPGEVLLLRPNRVKGGTAPLRLTKDLVARTLATLFKCGNCQSECVVYWTGPAGDDLVDDLDHPAHGRASDSYEVADGWLTDFWRRLASSGRSIKAQVHSHPAHAFHSVTDDQWPIISQPGFISIVVPNFAANQSSLERAWIGRLLPDGRWKRVASPNDAVTLT